MTCRSDAPNARTTSTMARLVLRTPANVLMTIGKNADRMTITILAWSPSPNHSWISGMSATDGVLYSAVTNGSRAW